MYLLNNFKTEPLFGQLIDDLTQLRLLYEGVDLDEELFHKVNSLSKKISHAIKKVVPCERIGVSVIGLEVPHAHVHLVPINSISDLDFTKDRVKLSSEEFKELADEISANL